MNGRRRYGDDAAASDFASLSDPMEEIDDAPPSVLVGEEEIKAATERMFSRITILTTGLFNRGYLDHAIPISFESQPSLRLIERLRTIVKLKIMAAELIDKIIPRIRRRISFLSERITETHRYTVKGILDPVRTLKANNNPISYPYFDRYVSRRPLKNFHTPENHLAVLTLLDLSRDARDLLEDPIWGSSLNPLELRILRDIVRQCRQALNNRLFARLSLEVHHRYHSRNSDRDMLIRQVHDRLRFIRGGQESYRDLVTWRERYQTPDLTAPGRDHSTQASAITPDHAYEILVLLELLVGMGRIGRVRQLSHLSGEMRSDIKPTFECRFKDGDRWEIYVQTSRPLQDYRYIPGLVGIPDMIIRNPASGRMLLGDAKQYTASSYGAAFYKMMGYLYQFGYPEAFSRIVGGVLFVPKRLGQEAGWSVRAGTIEGGRQAIATLTIPAEGVITKDSTWDCDRFISFAKTALRR